MRTTCTSIVERQFIRSPVSRPVINATGINNQLFGVGGPASSKEAAKRCTELNWTVGPTLIKRRCL
jgi:hypothetical protein